MIYLHSLSNFIVYHLVSGLSVSHLPVQHQSNSSLRQHFYQLFDRHASLTPPKLSKIICLSADFKKLICNDFSPPALEGHYAPYMLSHLTAWLLHMVCNILTTILLVSSLCQCKCCFHQTEGGEVHNYQDK